MLLSVVFVLIIVAAGLVLVPVILKKRFVRKAGVTWGTIDTLRTEPGGRYNSVRITFSFIDSEGRHRQGELLDHKVETPAYTEKQEILIIFYGKKSYILSKGSLMLA